MEIDAQSFSELIAARVAEMGGKVSAIEKGFGLKPDAIRNVMRATDGAGPTLTRAKEICDALGLELYIGPPRPSPSNHEKMAMAGDEAQGKDDAADFDLVERFDVKLSAGPGTDGNNARPLAPVAFRRDWLRDMYLTAKECIVTGISGDSMSPTLADGDLVLVDRRPQPQLSFAQLYALIDVDGQIRVKRIAPIDEGFILYSDNTEYGPEARMGEDAAALRIIGRVVWSGHKHGISIKKLPKAERPRLSMKPFKHVWL